MCVLTKQRHKWLQLDPPEQILDWLSGVKFPINANISKFEGNNENFNKNQLEFLSKAIQDLLLLGRIEKVTKKPYVISPIRCIMYLRKTKLSDLYVICIM